MITFDQLLRSEPWMARALCSQTDPEAFFPDKGGSVREAKRVCLTCDVRAECLDYALAHGEAFGIWGGLSERERRKITRLVPVDEQHLTTVDFDTDDDFIQEIA